MTEEPEAGTLRPIEHRYLPGDDIPDMKKLPEEFTMIEVEESVGDINDL